MDPQVQASFIPKRPLTQSGGGRGGGLFYLIAIFIFVVSLVTAGAAFAYTQYLKSALASKSHSLELAQGAYEPGSIQDLGRLDQRINHAKVLLSSHVAPSAIFALLSDLTLEKVQFTSFAYTLNGEEGADIELGGIADSFATVALQSDEFSSNRALRNVVFSAITVAEGGRVTFGISAEVDPSILLYSAVLKNPAMQASQTSEPAPASTSTPSL